MANGDVKKISDLSHVELLPEREYICPRHGAYWGQPMKTGFCEIIISPTCGECEKEMEAVIESAPERDSESRLEAMGIGKLYYNSDFTNFDAYTAELKCYAGIAENFANNPSGKLVMLGENGTGKTHLAVAILKAAGGVMHTMYEIGVMLRDSYSEGSNEKQTLKALCGHDLLVIDEVGRTKGGNWELDWMSHIVNTRHAAQKPLILISNRHLKQNCPGGGCDKCLENFFDNDVISRITEDGIVMRFTGEDYRKRTGAAWRESKMRELEGL